MSAGEVQESGLGKATALQSLAFYLQHSHFISYYFRPLWPKSDVR